MPSAFFVVRAIVTDAGKRAAFDRWYETEHLPDAVKAFGVARPGGSGASTIRHCIRRCISSRARLRCTPC